MQVLCHLFFIIFIFFYCGRTFKVFPLRNFICSVFSTVQILILLLLVLVCLLSFPMTPSNVVVNVFVFFAIQHDIYMTLLT